MAAWRRAIRRIDLVTGKVHALVKDRHRSREFIEFLSSRFRLSGAHGDQADPRQSFCTYLEGNQSLACRSAGARSIHFHPQPRFLAQSRRALLSELARSVLRHIRVSSKQELKDRLIAAVDYFNHDPVVHTWTYKLDKAA